MKRMHLHLSVDDLDQNITFYNTLFGSKPCVHKDDYAQWILNDPSVNFAISTQGSKTGLDHIGIQTDDSNELNELKARLETANMTLHSQDGTTCCYAKSNKHWLQDPSGIAWETYHTLESAPTFNEQTMPTMHENNESACCSPTQSIQLTKPKGKTKDDKQPRCC